MKIQRLAHRGITLTECIIAVGILAMVMGMAKMGVDWMVAVGRQRVLSNAQWSGQVALYEITRSIRNCKRIVLIAPGRLELEVYRPQEVGGFSDPKKVVEEDPGNLVYEFVRNGKDTFLKRTYTFPVAGGGTASRESKLLVNMLEEPVGALWMFKAFGVDVPGSYEAVEILVRLRPAFWGKEKHANPIEYRSISMKRTSPL